MIANKQAFKMLVVHAAKPVSFLIIGNSAVFTLYTKTALGGNVCR
jgi:hypothetical protein